MPYDVSGHFVWIGERTRQLDGAHVELLSPHPQPDRRQARPDHDARRRARAGRAAQPGQRAGPADLHHPDGRRQDPRRAARPGREGHRRRRRGRPGSATRCTATPSRRRSGYKTRRFDDVIDEVQGFFDVHRALGTWPGGMHVELTGDDVTECVGGGEALLEGDLGNRYESVCDPRLNRVQSLELAFLVAEMLREASDEPAASTADDRPAQRHRHPAHRRRCGAAMAARRGRRRRLRRGPDRPRARGAGRRAVRPRGRAVHADRVDGQRARASGSLVGVGAGGALRGLARTSPAPSWARTARSPA